MYFFIFASCEPLSRKFWGSYNLWIPNMPAHKYMRQQITPAMYGVILKDCFQIKAKQVSYILHKARVSCLHELIKGVLKKGSLSTCDENHNTTIWQTKAFKAISKIAFSLYKLNSCVLHPTHIDSITVSSGTPRAGNPSLGQEEYLSAVVVVFSLAHSGQ